MEPGVKNAWKVMVWKIKRKFAIFVKRDALSVMISTTNVINVHLGMDSNKIRRTVSHVNLDVPSANQIIRNALNAKTLQMCLTLWVNVVSVFPIVYNVKTIWQNVNSVCMDTGSKMAIVKNAMTNVLIVLRVFKFAHSV